MRHRLQVSHSGFPARRTPTSAPHSKRTWLFDLDNTLHDAGTHIFPHLHRSMMAYICHHLKITEAEAVSLRQNYWQRYGATLLGLMRHHGTDPRHFLHHTHQFPDLARIVIAERGLKAMLQRLPGRKIVFSNAPQKYIEAVLNIVGIRRCFDAVYSVERIRFRPKPDACGFMQIIREGRLNARNCIMVEDTKANLVTAKRLGMKTVLINTDTHQPPYVDVKLASVLELPARLGRL